VKEEDMELTSVFSFCYVRPIKTKVETALPHNSSGDEFEMAVSFSVQVYSWLPCMMILSHDLMIDDDYES
jgi:hypothetical protein